MSIATTNPFTNETLRTFPSDPSFEVEKKVAQAWSVYQENLPHLEDEKKKRAGLLLKVADLLDSRKEELARLITLEMGKPIKSSLSEIEKCAMNCRYYAENGLKELAPKKVELPRSSSSQSLKAEIRYLPIGVVLAIMPWNFPFWQVFRCAAPILLSGNSMLLKHASNVPQCALAIEQVIRDSGFKGGEFQTLLIGSKEIGRLIEDPRIQGVTLTGSEGAGSDVSSRAGKAIKKSVMELGGSDPFLIMPSADLKRAAKIAAQARLISNGQSCIAAKRFIVHEAVYPEFKSLFLNEMRAAKMGDPMDPSVTLGPLVSVKARDDLHELVKDAVEKGAKLLLGGAIPEGNGAFYPATVLESIPEESQIRYEEAFGPVAALYSVKGLEEGIRIANSTRFGLGASFWSSDPKEIETATQQIQSGSVFVNTLVASDPHLPFGGVKASGFGRELGTLGLHEFTNIKTIAIHEEGSPKNVSE